MFQPMRKQVFLIPGKHVASFVYFFLLYDKEATLSLNRNKNIPRMQAAATNARKQSKHIKPQELLRIACNRCCFTGVCVHVQTRWQTFWQMRIAQTHGLPSKQKDYVNASDIADGGKQCILLTSEVECFGGAFLQDAPSEYVATTVFGHC